GLNVPTGANLDIAAHIVLTVGSDCGIGKMTVSLELDREAQRRGLKSMFVPTGQTGIALNTRGLDEKEAARAVRQAAEETGLPADDPVRFGAAALLDAVLARLPGNYPLTGGRVSD